MYHILGSDGERTGPVGAETLREWIAQGRVTGQTRVQPEGTADWKLLADLPEFRDVLPADASVPSVAAPPPLPPSPSRPPSPSLPPPSAPRPRTSGLATASFILGWVAPCTLGVAGIIGLILGILALVRIGRSQGRLKGKGLAIAGLFLSAFFLITLPIALGFIVPFIAQQGRFRRTPPTCPQNLQNVAMALRLYAEGHDGKFPSAANWCEDATPYLQSPNLFKCPARPRDRCSYAFNRAIAGRTTSSVPPDTVLLMESARGWNATLGPEDPVSSSPHGDVYSVAFADGSVRELDRNSLPTLRWEP
jgi:hypothetical protein